MVSWYNRADNASSFVVYRLDSQGNPQDVDDVPVANGAGAGKIYSWTDTDTDQSGQCYMIAAVNASGDGDSPVECTVRPDPTQFPQNIPQTNMNLLQWHGLSGDNDGTGPLQSGVRDGANYLFWSPNTLSLNHLHLHCGCGVDLGWESKPSLWKVQAMGGPNAMYGEAVALRVWGGGWLEFAHQTFGVDLHLVSTPVYQWYILGETPGNIVDSSEFALWKSAASDFLVEANQTFGVDLNWYKKTLPPAPPPQPSPSGARLVVAYNCFTGERSLEMWVEDDTAGTGWADMGTVQSGWVDGGCSETASDSWSFSPISGHTYEVDAVDFGADGCSNDPTLGQCVVSHTPGIVGNSNGGVVTIPIDD